MLKGSCLCGGIRYEIDAELGPVTNCHCSQCRKAAGAAFAQQCFRTGGVISLCHRG